MPSSRKYSALFGSLSSAIFSTCPVHCSLLLASISVKLLCIPVSSLYPTILLLSVIVTLAMFPSPDITLAVVFSDMPSTILTSGYPIHRSVAMTISLGTVSKGFSKSKNPIACTPSLVSTICLRKHIPSAVPLPFLNPHCSSPKSPSTRVLFIASKTLSNSCNDIMACDLQ